MIFVSLIFDRLFSIESSSAKDKRSIMVANTLGLMVFDNASPTFSNAAVRRLSNVSAYGTDLGLG